MKQLRNSLIIWLWWHHDWFIGVMNVIAFIIPYWFIATMGCDVMDIKIYLWFCAMNALAAALCIVTNPEQKEKPMPPYRGGIIDMGVM